MSNIAKVGDRVFVTDPYIAAEFSGAHGDVISVDPHEGASLPIMVRFTRPDGTQHSTWVHRDTYSVTQPDPATVLDTDIVEPTRRYSLPMNMTLDEARSIIDRMEADFRELQDKHDLKERLRNDAVERLSEQQRRYSHDMNAIERIMREVKDEQSWCDDGWNGVVERVNDALEGGFEFEKARKLVRKHVHVRGETTVDIEVWVYEDEDEDDTDNWKDEDGDEIGDPDEFMQDNLKEEFRRCSSQFDTVEVA